MKDFLSKLLFLFALAAIFFAYGFFAHFKEIFPYQIIREGSIAFKALIELGKGSQRLPQNVDFWDETGLTGPKAQQLSPEAGQENIFILGNNRVSLDGEATIAWISDRRGKILHSWKHPDGEIWAPLSGGRDAIRGTWQSYPTGAHLFANGDILVSYQSIDVFPIAMGIAKFDRDSNLLWKNDGYYHHWFSVSSDGEIYVPKTMIATSPYQLEDHDKFIICEEGRFTYDSIAVLDQNGEELRSIDLMQAIIQSDLAGLINSNKEDYLEIETCDPLHLNDVRILTSELASEFSRFSPGDLLLSFRSLNGIGVLDGDTDLFKWFYVGSSHHQHSPRYLDDDRVLMFDNYGGRISRGRSRILSVAVKLQAPEIVFPPPDSELPEKPFVSVTAGHIDIDNSRQRILVSWTHKGLIWEINIETGEVLWEYLNTHPVDGQFGRISVRTAKYVDEMSFPLNGGISN